MEHHARQEQLSAIFNCLILNLFSGPDQHRFVPGFQGDRGVPGEERNCKMPHLVPWQQAQTAKDEEQPGVQPAHAGVHRIHQEQWKNRCCQVSAVFVATKDKKVTTIELTLWSPAVCCRVVVVVVFWWGLPKKSEFMQLWFLLMYIQNSVKVWNFAVALWPQKCNPKSK